MEQQKSRYLESGPWDSEPDEKTWTDSKTGYGCLILRNKRGGNLCGYVRIPDGHPLFEVGYTDSAPDSFKPFLDSVMNGPTGKRGAIDVFCLALGSDPNAGILFNVHGGITFSGGWDEHPGFWYGFDCAHCDDLCPGYQHTHEGEYRDMEYVESECTALAAQLHRLAA